MKGSQEVEGEISRVLEFLNSRGVGFEAGIDRLGSIHEAAEFVHTAYGMDTQVPHQSLQELKRLRTVLLKLIESGWTSQTALTELNAIAAERSFTVVFRSASSIQLTTKAAADVLAMILRDVASVVEAGQWSRLKNCSNEACSSTFFDRSRNKTQRWHSFEVCGNKHNVAAHRARLR